MDDFFAKKDKKGKKGPTGKKLGSTQMLTEEAPSVIASAQLAVESKPEMVTQRKPIAAGVLEDDGNWDSGELERKHDYSGLKVKSLAEVEKEKAAAAAAKAAEAEAANKSDDDDEAVSPSKIDWATNSATTTSAAKDGTVWNTPAAAAAPVAQRPQTNVLFFPTLSAAAEAAEQETKQAKKDAEGFQVVGPKGGDKSDKSDKGAAAAAAATSSSAPSGPALPNVVGGKYVPPSRRTANPYAPLSKP